MLVMMVGRCLVWLVGAVSIVAGTDTALAQQSEGLAVALPSQANVEPSSSATGADVPRSEFIRSMDADFRSRDINGDGRVTRSEMEQFEREASILAAQLQNRNLFVSLDTDQNGSLTLDEFARLLRDMPGPDVSAQMQRLDLNRDQVVTIVEFRTATLVNFDRMDSDKDGIVTEQELRSYSASASSVPSR